MEKMIKSFKTFFRAFYVGICIFIGLTLIFIAISFYTRYQIIYESTINAQMQYLNFIEMNLKKSGELGLQDTVVQPLKLGAQSSHVEHILVIQQDATCYFIDYPSKKYIFGGVDSKGTLTLNQLKIEDNVVTLKQLSSGEQLLAFTANKLLRDRVYKEMNYEHKVQFSLFILCPLILMMILWMLEERFLTSMRNYLSQYSSEMATNKNELSSLYIGLFKQNQSIMMLVDPQNGEIIDVNDKARKYYGYDFDHETITVYDINTMKREELAVLVQEATLDHKSYFNFKHKLKNGSVRNVEVYSGPIEFNGRALLCSIIHDVTEKVRLEQEVARYNEIIEKRLQEKTDILTTLSHEIKTPMTGISMLLKDLRSNVYSSEGVKQLEFLSLNIHNLNRVVFDLLDYSKLEIGKLRIYNAPFNLPQVLNAGVELFRPLANDKKIQLSLNLEELTQNDFVGDAMRLGQIINNLISNGIKYTTKGTVKVSAKSQHVGDRCLVTLEVEDTGIGMKPEVVSQIFDKFFTADESGNISGTGLGLGICRMIVEAMDGTLEVSSKLGVGTKMTVMIELEKSYGMHDITYSQAPLLSQEELESIRVLLIDDDPLSQLFIEKSLQTSAANIGVIDRAISLQEASKLLSNHVYQLIFSDYQLIDGYADQLFDDQSIRDRVHENACFRVLISAVERQLFEPFDAFMMKPITEEAVHEILDLFNVMENVRIYQKARTEDAQSFKHLKMNEIFELKAFIGEEEMPDMLELYSSSLKEKIDLLEGVLLGDSVEELAKALHTIKGSISYLHVNALVNEINLVEAFLKTEAAWVDKKERVLWIKENLTELLTEINVLIEVGI